jgi:hypothetical protein
VRTASSFAGGGLPPLFEGSHGGLRRLFGILVSFLFCFIVWFTPSALAIGSHFRFSLSGVQVISEFRKCQIIFS